MERNIETVERKVQLTGGSTYTVSLPKEWADSQGIKPGTTVRLHVDDETAVMTTLDNEEAGTGEITLDATGQDPAALARSVAAGYMAGCETVHVENLRNTTTRRAVTRSIRRLVGFEVMTAQQSELTARAMLDVADLSPAQTLTQVQRTALDMHAEAFEALVEANGTLGEQVAGQDDTVDRLFALLSRRFQQSLVAPTVTSGGHRSAFEYYIAARQLERVADHAQKVAALTGRIGQPPPADIAESFVSLGSRSRELVSNAIGGLLEPDNDTALDGVVGEAERLREDLAAFDEQLYDRSLADGYLLGLAVDSLVRTTEYGVNIAEAGLRAGYRQACR